jgi:hypothetical protein
LLLDLEDTDFPSVELKSTTYAIYNLGNHIILYSPNFSFGCFSCFLFSFTAPAELDWAEEDEEEWSRLVFEALEGTIG